jgi:hypothetical protein
MAAVVRPHLHHPLSGIRDVVARDFRLTNFINNAS